MIHAAVLLLALAGFILLLLAMTRHQQDWLRRKLSGSAILTLRAGGFAALALAFITAGANLGWAYGAVAWFGWLSVTSAIVVVVNLNRARMLHLCRKAWP